MKSMNRFMLLTVLTFCTLSALATEDSDKLNYAYETYTDGTNTLPYRKAEINVDEGAGVKPLLAIYLHGGSSRGNDNELQMQEPGKDSIANYLLAHKIPAILVVPQCPAGGSWGGQMLAVVYGMLKQFTDARQVNLDRVYIFGGSMGGTGTWSMLSAYPGFFAAAMPCAANPSGCDPDKVSKTPAYTVMGSADRLMSVATAQDFVSQITALNADCRMEVADGWDHRNTCEWSYTTPRLDWVFAHNKSTNTSAVTSPQSQAAILSRTYYTLDGRKVSTPETGGIYLLRELLSDESCKTVKVRF